MKKQIEMKTNKPRLTLDQIVTYEIRIPGQLDKNWQDWAGDLKITVESTDDCIPITTICGQMDQAGLQGLLRRLYALGLPLISVNWIDSIEF